MAAVATGGLSNIDGGDDSLASAESVADQAAEIAVELYFDDAEISRLSSQLLSDIAACTGDETGSLVALPDVSEYHGDLTDPFNQAEHEYPLIV